MREKTLLCVIILTITLALLSSCAASRAIVQQDINSIRPVMKAGGEEDKAVIIGIEERNRTVEDSPAWIQNAYEGLKIRRLNSVSEKEYEDYRKFLENGAVYVIVHPGYFPFFQYKDMPAEEKQPEEDYLGKKNVVERLLSVPPPDINFSVLQAQERRTRDFLEYKSTEEKLIIIVLPRNYKSFKGYVYKNGIDEYARYLNEVTNLSKSVLFVESKSASRGYLLESDMVRLLEFLSSIGAKKVYVGGGYIGRCLEDFYIDISDVYGSEDVFIVPELSDVSPRELKGGLARGLLMPDGTIDVGVATQNLKTEAYGTQEIRPKLRNLP